MGHATSSASHHRALVALTLLAITACSDTTGPEGPAECTTAITESATFVQLCSLSQPVRHVRIENLTAARTHASAQILFGFDAAPTATSGALAEGQFRVLFYGGGMPAPTPAVQATYESVDATLESNAAFINAGATVCFDLHDGNAASAPAVVLWVSGQQGADCNDRSTLTTTSAYAAHVDWGTTTTGAIASSSKDYFRQTAASSGLSVTLSDAAVLDAASFAAVALRAGR
jgi:hypothetical protein